MNGLRSRRGVGRAIAAAWSARRSRAGLATIGCLLLVAAMRSPVAAPIRASRGADREANVLTGARAGITGVQFSPDGLWLASSSLDGVVRVWSTADWKLAHEFVHGAEVYAVAFAPDGDVVASTGFDRRVMSWELDGGEQHFVVTLPDWSLTLAYAPSGEVVVGGEDGKVRLLDPITGAVGRTIEIGGEILGLSLSAQGDTLATSPPIQLRDLESGRPVKRIQGHGQNGLAFSPDGELFAAAEATAGAHVWSAASGKLVASLRLDVEHQALGPNGYTKFAVNMPATSVAFSRDGKWLATGGTNCEIQLWSVANGAVATSAARSLRGHEMTVTSVSFAPDSKWIASGSLDRTVRVWKIE